MGEQRKEERIEDKRRLSAAGLRAFVEESNRIEGIEGVNDEEIAAHTLFLSYRQLQLGAVCAFVRVVAEVGLRDKPGMNVRVGAHIPILGGERVRDELRELLDAVNEGELTPYEAHVRYEKLHPFMDGNGRSGRAIWAWQMLRAGQDPFVLPFLHRFYYQALGASQNGGTK